jgi:hypothetical protein
MPTLHLEEVMQLHSRLLCAALGTTLLTQLAACGTVFYPDRRGQIEGKLDPVVVGGNAIGLLFFIIPGVIAFAVDFATGAIYLPEGKYSVAPQQLRDTLRADGSIDAQRLKALLQRELQRDLPLDDPRLQQRNGSAQQLAALGLRPAA